MLEAQRHNPTLSYIVPSPLMTYTFLIAVGFYIYSSSLLLLEQRSRIVKHAWSVCLPWLMDQTKTNKAFEKSLHAVSKLWSSRSSHSPSQLFSSPLIYVAWLFILPLSGPFVCLVCIQKIQPCHPLPTLGHRARKKKTEWGRGEQRQPTRKPGGKDDLSSWLFHCSVNVNFSKLSREGNWIVSQYSTWRKKKKSQTEPCECCSNIQICVTTFYLINFHLCVIHLYLEGPADLSHF